MADSAQSTPKSRKLDSWIGGFLHFTEGLSSPKLFRKWAAITALGACLERRVWVWTSKGPTYANMFVILVGRPGIGKSEAINNIRNIVKGTYSKDLWRIATELIPYDVTKGAMLDKLSKYTRYGLDPWADTIGLKERVKYHSAFLAVSELGDLVREHDHQLLSALHSLFDCLPVVEEERRYRENDPISIVNPSMALLGGTTTAYLSRTFPPAAWDEGFMARTILIYSADKIDPDLFNDLEIDMTLVKELVDDLRQISKLEGRMNFTDEAKASIRAWQKAGQPPQPEHARLEHYNTRRMRHALKLSMISAINKGNALLIDAEDFQQALTWMIEAEKAMPQIFLEIVGRADGQVQNELYLHVRGICDSPLHGNRPVSKAILVDFLRSRVSSWQIESVIETCCEAELLIKCPQADNTIKYRPNPKPSLLRPKKT